MGACEAHRHRAVRSKWMIRPASPHLAHLQHCCPDKVLLMGAAGPEARRPALRHGPDMPDQSLLIRVALLARVLKQCRHEVLEGRPLAGRPVPHWRLIHCCRAHRHRPKCRASRPAGPAGVHGPLPGRARLPERRCRAGTTGRTGAYLGCACPFDGRGAGRPGHGSSCFSEWVLFSGLLVSLPSS